MDAKLIIVGGKANKGHVSLKLPTLIGRSREADLTIAHPMVSRRHCELFEENGLLMVRDLGSLNGTIVGKERITKAVPVRPNAEFTVGPLTFRAEYEYVGAIAGPPQPTRAQPSAEEQEPPGLFDVDESPADEGEFPGLEAEGPPDFALGPAKPPSSELEGLLAGAPPSVSEDDDAPPAFDSSPGLELPAFDPPTPPTLPPGQGKKTDGGRNNPKEAQEQAADSAAPASANGQKPPQPKEFSEEDLDEFFKDAI